VIKASGKPNSKIPPVMEGMTDRNGDFGLLTELLIGTIISGFLAIFYRKVGRNYHFGLFSYFLPKTGFAPQSSVFR
jgi:hypothetical protein